MNIFGGVLAGLILLGLQFLWRFFNARGFKKFFGYSKEEYQIVYGLYESPHNAHFPLPKSSIDRPRCRVVGVNFESVTSGAQTKSVSYIVNAFGKNAGILPLISSHSEVDEKMAISFISIGGTTNFKTVDLLENPSNKFLDFKNRQIVNKQSGKVIVELQNNFDYGIITKIHPDNNPDNTWICCAGFGVWGTSGAAYYLANRWKEIRKWAGYEPFSCIVETKLLIDDSTFVVERFREKIKPFVEPIRWIISKIKDKKITIVT